jgi:hypothetical protein
MAVQFCHGCKCVVLLLLSHTNKLTAPAQGMQNEIMDLDPNSLTDLAFLCWCPAQQIP